MVPGVTASPCEDETVKHFTKDFVNARGKKIQCYYWTANDPPKALLLISHGFTEHCMEYDELAKALAKNGFFVLAHDHVGHGHSGGQRAYFNSMQHLIDDSAMHIRSVRETYTSLPLFICGVSLGAEVAFMLAVGKEFQVAGVLFIGPSLKPNPETSTLPKVIIAKIMNALYPQCPINYSDYNLATRNKAKLQAMTVDPLRYKGFLRVRPLISILHTAHEVMKRTGEFDTPVCILHGGDDKICHVDGAREFMANVKSRDKTLKVYDGGYHSLLFDLEETANAAFQQTVTWLTERIK